MSARLQIVASAAKIRAALGTIGLLHAGDELERADVADAITTIDQELIAIEHLSGVSTGEIPILTLADIPRTSFRAEPPRPSLHAIQGGKP